MLFNTQEDLKNFIVWCKAQKVKQIKLDTIEIVLSDYALIEDLVAPPSQNAATPAATQKPSIADPNNGPKQNGDEDPDLFFSVP